MKVRSHGHIARQFAQRLKGLLHLPRDADADGIGKGNFYWSGFQQGFCRREQIGQGYFPFKGTPKGNCQGHLHRETGQFAVTDHLTGHGNSVGHALALIALAKRITHRHHQTSLVQRGVTQTTIAPLV